MIRKKYVSLFTLIALLIFTSCGGKKETTKANVILLGNLNSVISTQTGGTMLLGHNKTTGAFFSKIFTVTNLELPNGDWDFAVVSWDGFNPVDGDLENQMEGVMRCAVLRGALLNGGETAVPLTLSQAACRDPFFGSDEHKNFTTGELLPIAPTVCTDEKGVFETFDPGTCKNSIPQSFRIRLPETGITGEGTGIISECVTEDAPNTPEIISTNTQVKVPIIGPGPWPLRLGITLYEGPNCTGTEDFRWINNPYTGEASRGFVRLNDNSTIGTHVEMRILANPCDYPNGNIQMNPFLPNVGEPFIICNADQFANYIPTNLGANYELYKDLDFSGLSPFTTSVINNTFSGIFNGRGHLIHNVTINQAGTGPAALFRQIDGVASLPNGDAHVGRLRLANFNITSAGNSNGALAGNVFWGTSINSIEAQNITLNLNSAATQSGGLIGHVVGGDTALTNGGVRTEIWGIRAFDVTVNISANHTRIGGLIGRMDSSTALRHAFLDGLFLGVPLGAPSLIGGIVGEQNGPNSELWSVTGRNIFLGTTTSPLSTISHQIGGLVGRSNEGRIFHGKANATITSGGNDVGGLIGAAWGGDFQNNVSIVDMPISPSGTNTGGHIGYKTVTATMGINVTNSRAFGNVRCSGIHCGGFTGYINHTSPMPITIMQSYSKANVESTSNNVGGFAGRSVSNQNTQSIQFMETAAFGSVKGTHTVGGHTGSLEWSQVTDSFSSNISVESTTGSRAGLFAIANNSTIDRLYTDSPLIGAGTPSKMCIDAFATLVNTNVFRISDSAADAECTGGNIALASSDTLGSYTTFTSPPWIARAGELLNLKHIDSLEGVGEEYTGSKTDPIMLSSPSQWNSIGDKPSLMNKTYRLANNIDFGANPTNFVPIGSLATPFAGQLQGNNFAIANIDYIDNQNGPLGLFRALGVAPFSSATEIAHYDSSNYDTDYSLNIVNVRLQKGTGQTGQIGLLAGIINDNGDNINSPSYHDYNKSIQLSDINIVDSYVYGGRAATASSVGGLVGLFNHTNGQSTIRDITISNTEVYSDLQILGTGGVFGRFIGNLNINQTPPFRQFDTFRLNNVTVSSAGDYVGGILGYTSDQSADWEFLFVENSNIFGRTYVGGLFGALALDNIVSYGSFTGSVSANGTDAGGIVGTANGGILSNFYIKGSVSAGGTNAGCAVGKGTGVLPLVNNSVALCSSVTASTTASYMGVSLATPSISSIYIRPDNVAETLPIGYQLISPTDLLDPSITSTYLFPGDPWVLEPGVEPLPFWTVYPEFF